MKDNQTRTVNWNADVHILGQSPELVIGANGEILKAVNVSVRTAANAQQTSGTIAAGEAEVFVNDLRNSSSGQVYFNDAGDAVGTGTVSISGSGSTWDFSDTYRQVLITNHSNKTLRINNIDVVNTVANPLVDLNGRNVSLTFAIDRVVTPTLVQVLNLSSSDVILNGTINDPIGSTVIRNSGGAITAARARDVAEAVSGRVSLVTTAILDLQTPASDIGSASARVNVDMVYGASALPATHFRTTDVADLADAVFLGSGSLFDGQLVKYETSGAAIGGLVHGNYYVVLRAGTGASIQLASRDADGTVHVVALDPSTAAPATVHTLTPAQQVVGVAGGDIALDLKARLRAEAAVDTVTATVDSLRAGGTIDLLLQDSVQEYGASASSGVRVTTLNETTIPFPSVTRDKNFASFFRPDGGAARFQDLGAFGGTSATPRDSVYDFRDLDTSGNRTVAGLIAGNTNGNIIITARQPQPADIQISVIGITDILGSGHIDVLTNGSIVLSEHAGDMRVGDIHSTADDVTLTAPASIVDALADTAADVTGVNITLTALGGRIGSAGNFLETDLLDTVSGIARAGVLRADAQQDIFIEETTGDLRVHHVASAGGNATLVSRNGSILDGHDDIDAAAADGRFRDADGRTRDAVNVSALHIALDARGGGSIGLAGDDLDVDSRSGGHLFAQAAQNVYITEADGALEVLAARALGGDLRLTVPDTSAIDTENLVLLASGLARVNEGGDTVVSIGEIAAFATVALWIGDNVNTSAHSRIVAGSGISLRGDTRRVGKTDDVDAAEVDDGHGTQMDLRGTIGFIDAPASVTVVNMTDKAFTGIFGHDDIDTFTFNQTRLDANTTVHGSWKTSGETLLAHDGEDRFVVNQLAAMHVDRNGVGDTLTLDGQSDTDYYEIRTAGSQTADPQNYVVNVLDTGAKDNGVDELKILGFDSGANGIGQATDDIFLLRAMTGIPSEASESPAFVALLHGTLAQAMAGTSPAQVERINYDANLNGRLIVDGLGGNDYFAVDDNSTITTLDGGAGDDTFQIGQIFGSQRSLGANLAASDVFGTVATTRGYLSRGTSAPLLAEGGSGDDVFQVYSNQAALRLEGNGGDDLFIVRGFALAETDADGRILTDAAGVAIRKAGNSTAASEILNGGDGNDFIQYNINAPVSIDGGTGFDKVVVLGTEFGDNFVITDQGVYGAGLNVSYANIELLEVDGLEGDDHFTIQSTPFGVATRVIGGLGNDIFNVAGDVADVVTTQELEGQSGVINHEASSIGDLGYDGLLVSGINLNVAGLPGGDSGSLFSGNVIIDESDGMSLVHESATGDWGTVDSYTMRLAVPVAAGTRVYVTVSAARSLQEEQDAAGHGDSVLVSTDADFVRDVVRNGLPLAERNRAVVLVFDSTNWNIAQTVHVAAANDGLEEGKRVVAVSHNVQAVVVDGAASTPTAEQQATLATYHGIKVRNVLVTVIDNDSAGIVLTEIRKDAYDNGTLVLEGAAPYGIADAYTIALAKAPTAPVIVQLDYDRAQLQLSHDSVTFDAGNWNMPVTITVTAVNDSLREDQKLSLIKHVVSASADSAYFSAGASTVSETLAVTVADDDVPGVLVQQSNGGTLVAAGAQPLSDTYTVRLNSAPLGTVVITPRADGTTTASTVTFDANNWWLPQVVTVTAVTITDPASPLLHPGVKAFAVQPHLLSDIKGTLEIDGGVGATVYPLIPALMLPGETNAPVLGIAVQPPESQSIDILNVFDDSSLEDKQGVLTGTQLTGLNLAAGLQFDRVAHGESADFAAGITYGRDGQSNIEVFNLLMGSGNDDLTIESTLQTTADHGGLTIIHGGGNLVAQAAVAGAYTGTIDGDRITVIGGGGPTSPLVVYGDTSQDASWYAGRPYDADTNDTLVLGPNPLQAGVFYRLPRANPYDRDGNDVIDAHQASPDGGAWGADALGIVIYGGGGNDTIIGTQIGDVLAGGSGDDTIFGQGGDDQIYGDSGINIDIISRTLSVPTTDAPRPSNDNPDSNRDFLLAGRDTILGDGGDDIIFGDHGIVQQMLPAAQKILNVRRVMDIRTDQPANGADDVIHGNDGRDRIFGGNGADIISGDAGSDVIFGDHGHMSYVSGDYFGQSDTDLSTLDLVESVDTLAAWGGNDTITDDASDDIILGGQGDDTVDAGGGQNIVFGDHGLLRGVDSGANTPVIDANVPAITRIDDDYQMQVLGLVTSIDWGTVNGGANAFGNGNDTITTGSGRDMVFGGGGDDAINTFASAGGTAAMDGNNIVFGDHGLVDYLAQEIAQNDAAAHPVRTNDIDRVWSIATAFGGNDTILTGHRNDIVLGGFGDDVIDTGNGYNIALGDSGRLTSDDRDWDNRAQIVFAVHDFIVCKIETWSDGDFSDGGADTITGSDLNDLIFGGSGGDTIYAGSGDDLVFGDQGMVECANGMPFVPEISLRPVCVALGGFLSFSATNTTTLVGSGDDLIFGQDGDDVLMGQQGRDTLYGGNGDDILIGGSNVAGALDSDDRIDGGAGNDAIAGDNADICYRPDAQDARFRVLSGTQVYYVAGAENAPDAATLTAGQFAVADSLVTSMAQSDPRGGSQYRIVLLDHVQNDGLVGTDMLATTPADRYGNDYIAGGAGADEIFGQLGNDVIQGDGTIGVAAGSTAAQLSAAQLSLGMATGGNYLLPVGFTAFGGNRGIAATAQADFDFSADAQVDLTIHASFEGSGDGDDYIEGNGGNDVVFGNLGQDDIIGGSSDLYGLAVRSQRPDGSDLLFGGAGTDVARNHIGDASIDAQGVITVKTDGHALDADTIIGDNGRILRLVGVNGVARGTGTIGALDAGANGVASTGGLLNYNYDNEAVGSGPGYHRIVVRAVDMLDYTQGGVYTSLEAQKDRGGADEIHGESGDDFIYGQLGNDVLYGEGQSDDLIGGTGNDWISGGTGDDGVIGDDGRFMTSRNSLSGVAGSAGYLVSLGEALNGVAKLLVDNGDTRTFNGNMLNEAIATPGNIQQATINLSGALKKAVNLTPFSVDPDWSGSYDEFVSSGPKQNDPFDFADDVHYSDDIIFGGLGSDWLHGGSGDDAILGGEALDLAYTQVYNANGALAGVARSDYVRPYNPGDVLRFNPIDVDGWHYDSSRRAGEFALYDEYDPLRKITLNADGTANKTDAGGLAWFLNFATHEGEYVPAGTNPKPVGQSATGYPQAWDDGGDRSPATKTGPLAVPGVTC